MVKTHLLGRVTVSAVTVTAVTAAAAVVALKLTVMIAAKIRTSLMTSLTVTVNFKMMKMLR